MKALLLPALLIAGGYGLMKAFSGSTSDETPAPQGKSLQSMTASQKSKLESWAKSKGVPVDKAYELAKSVWQMNF